MKEQDRNLWIDRIKGYRSSGQIAATWREEHGVSLHSLRHYICKFNKENKSETIEEAKETQWASIDIPNITQTENNIAKLKVTIGQATIEIDSNFDPDTFESVVTILSRC